MREFCLSFHHHRIAPPNLKSLGLGLSANFYPNFIEIIRFGCRLNELNNNQTNGKWKSLKQNRKEEKIFRSDFFSNASFGCRLHLQINFKLGKKYPPQLLDKNPILHAIEGAFEAQTYPDL